MRALLAKLLVPKPIQILRAVSATTGTLLFTACAEDPVAPMPPSERSSALPNFERTTPVFSNGPESGIAQQDSLVQRAPVSIPWRTR